VACANAPTARDARADIGSTFTELNAAARAACQWVWEHEPRAKDMEYCGALYRDEDGIRVGLPMTRGRGTCGSPDGEPSAPEGTKLLGKYHSHRFMPEPSPPDVELAKEFPSLGHFLCAPSGIVRRFSAEGTVIVK
jgi:proteasome lid subunit RPN8/RPN11